MEFVFKNLTYNIFQGTHFFTVFRFNDCEAFHKSIINLILLKISKFGQDLCTFFLEILHFKGTSAHK